jgi:hypothetical protein
VHDGASALFDDGIEQARLRRKLPESLREIPIRVTKPFHGRDATGAEGKVKVA